MIQPVFLIQGFRSNQKVFGLWGLTLAGVAEPVSRTGDPKFRAADIEYCRTGHEKERGPYSDIWRAPRTPSRHNP